MPTHHLAGLLRVPSYSTVSVGAEVIGTADMAHTTHQSVVDEQTGPRALFERELSFVRPYSTQDGIIASYICSKNRGSEETCLLRLLKHN